MRKLPPLNAVRAFEAVARHTSFNRAAEELNVTPSALSHQVRLLEDYYEVPLFVRDGRRIRLSEAGEAFLPGVSIGLDRIAAAALALARIGRSPVLTVSVAPTFAMGWLVSRLSGFQSTHPQIEVRLTLSATQSGSHFTSPEIDVAIAYGMGDWPDARCDRIMSEALVPVCSPELAAPAGPLAVPGDVRKVTLLHSMPRICQWGDWLRIAGVTGVDADRGTKFATTPLAMEAAIAGAGVAIANPRFVEPHLAAGRLVMPFTIDLPSEAGYYLLYAPDRVEEPAIAAFRGWLLEQIRLDAEVVEHEAAVLAYGEQAGLTVAMTS